MRKFKFGFGKRSLLNLFKNRPFQSRICAYIVGGTLGLALIVSSLLYIFSNNIRNAIYNTPSMPFALQTQIEEQLSMMFFVTNVVMFIAALFTFIYGVIISHKFSGPLAVILDQIQTIKAGQVGRQRHLRAGDELAPIVESLNELSVSLKNRRA